MDKRNGLSSFLYTCLLCNNFIVESVTSQHNGFRLRQLKGSPMTSLKCSATHIPSDVIDLYSINIAYRHTSRAGGKSLVIGSLKAHGEY